MSILSYELSICKVNEVLAKVDGISEIDILVLSVIGRTGLPGVIRIHGLARVTNGFGLSCVIYRIVYFM